MNSRVIPDLEGVVNTLICNDSSLPPRKQEKDEDEVREKPESVDIIQYPTVFNLENGNSNLPMRKQNQGNGKDNMEESQSPNHNVVCLKKLRNGKREVDTVIVSAWELADALDNISLY